MKLKSSKRTARVSEISSSNQVKKNKNKGVIKGIISEHGDSYIPLKAAEDLASDDEYEFESMGLTQSFTPEATDDEDDELVEEADEQYSEEDEDRVHWGKKLKNYYVDESEEESDEDAINDRIVEAKKITEELYEDVDEDDAEIDAYVQSEDEHDDTMSLDSLKKLLSESLKSETVQIPPDFLEMNENDRIKFIESEQPEFLTLLKDFKSKLDITNEQVIKLLDDPDAFKLCTKDGIEFLDLRNELLLIYTSYLAYYLLLKIHGVSIEDHPVVNRLLELRIMLDKAKPIESRLQYQITKLLETPDLSGDVQLRSRIDMMDDTTASTYRSNHKAKTNKMDKRYNGKHPEEEDLDVEFNDIDPKVAKFMKKVTDRERYEMESMRRIPLNKKTKKDMKNIANQRSNLFGTASLNQLISLPSNDIKYSKKKSISANLNTAAQKMKQSILLSEKRNNPNPSFNKSNNDKVKYTKLERPEGKISFDDEITRIQQKYSDEKKRVRNEDNRYKHPQLDYVDGKRDIGKDIMKNKGLTVKRDKTKGNARVQNRKKFEKKQKKFNAMKGVNRIEGPSYSGEDTGINFKKKKSINI